MTPTQEGVVATITAIAGGGTLFKLIEKGLELWANHGGASSAARVADSTVIDPLSRGWSGLNDRVQGQISSLQGENARLDAENIRLRETITANASRIATLELMLKMMKRGATPEMINGDLDPVPAKPAVEGDHASRNDHTG